MKTDSVIMDTKSTKNLTNEERDDEMVKLIQEKFKIGDITEPVRLAIKDLSRNIMVRDLMLSGMGYSVEQREIVFRKVNTALYKKDEEILSMRKQKGVDIMEPKRISVSQEKKYLSEGWRVVERSECGRYVYMVKE